MSNLNKKSFAVAKGLSAFTQLGLCTAVPVVLIIWGTSWLQQKFSLGDWVLPVGILFGLACGMYTFYKEAKILMEDKPVPSETASSATDREHKNGKI